MLTGLGPAVDGVPLVYAGLGVVGYVLLTYSVVVEGVPLVYTGLVGGVLLVVYSVVVVVVVLGGYLV